MVKVDKPKGLVRYASENGILNNEKLRYTGRMKFYSIVLILLAGILTFLIISRKDISGTIMRAEGMLFQERGLDSTSNLYTVKLSNKTSADLSLNFKLENIENGRIQIIGGSTIKIKAESQGAGSFFVILPNEVIKKRSTILKIGIYHDNIQVNKKSTKFLGPIN